MDGCGSVAPAAGLPDPAQWSAVLALAIAQVLTGIRTVSQLDRWLNDAVLADVRCAVRQRQRLGRIGPSAKTPRVSVASIRAQCPIPTAVETAAHVRVGSRSVAMALRLEACGGRWLATALETAPPLWSGSRIQVGGQRAPDRPWHILNFLPEPHGQGAFRPTPANSSESCPASVVVVAAPSSSGAE